MPKSYDVCIIGAGAAGITVAMELKDTDLKVCLIESGGYEFNQKKQDLYKGPVTGPLAGSETYLYTSRLRFFGGSTNHWGGWCRPLEEQDFEQRPWVPNSGWPIKLQDIKPHLNVAAEYLDIESFDYEFNSTHKTPNPLFQTQADSPYEVKYFHFSQPTTRFKDKYKDDLEKASNIEVLTDHDLIEFLPNKDKTAASQVKLLTTDKQQKLITAKRFVLACGGIENPRALLSSKQFSEKGMGNENDLVGRFFMEHPELYFAADVKFFNDIDKKLFMSRPVRSIQGKSLGVLAPNKNFLESIQSLNIAIEIEKDKSQNPHVDDLEPMNTLYQGVYPKHSALMMYQLYSLTLRAEQAPNPDSRVRLLDEKTDIGTQKVALDWRLTELDYNSVFNSLMALSKYFGIHQVGRINIRDFATRAKYKTAVGGNHHMGTTRMSETDKTGVVDKNCKLHNVNNVYMAGSSVFATGGFANPTLSLVAFSVRLAEHLKETAKEGNV
jgi:choline dehydrogenase-like flavoprotein